MGSQNFGKSVSEVAEVVEIAGVRLAKIPHASGYTEGNTTFPGTYSWKNVEAYLSLEPTTYDQQRAVYDTLQDPGVIIVWQLPEVSREPKIRITEADFDSDSDEN